MHLCHFLSWRMSTAAIALAIVLANQRSATAEEISAVLDLVTATATENTFDIRVEVLGESDTQSVVYTGLLRPVMDIDFTDPMAPVVNTLDFVGVVGDIAHTDAVFTATLGTAEFNNITGRVETPIANSPAPVTGGGTFSSSDHQLIAWSGTIEVTPLVGSPTTIDLNTNTFSGTFNGTNDSTVNVAFNSLGAGVQVYDVDITAVLDDVQLTTGDALIDGLIGVFVTGNVVASGQFTRPIPEPAAIVQATCLLAETALIRLVRLPNRRPRPLA